jgi:hypothetical protein
LRVSGQWQLGGCYGRRSMGLTWWPDCRLVDREYGSLLAEVSRRVMPTCHECGLVPVYTHSTRLRPAGNVWWCTECRWDESVRDALGLAAVV